MKKILIIDESDLFRIYLAENLELKGFEIVQAKSGLEGVSKLRTEIPDLIVMEYSLSRKSALELLQEKKENPNTKNVPVIIVTSKLDASKVIEMAPFGVQKVFSKPIKMDTFLKTLSGLLKVDVELDMTPCIIETHFNDDILFIEIARGINLEKVELLKFKIQELMALYNIPSPKVLVMISNVEISDDESYKFYSLLDVIFEQTQTSGYNIRILTSLGMIKTLVNAKLDYKGIQVVDNLEAAMNSLLGLAVNKMNHDDMVRDKLLDHSNSKREKESSFQMKFDNDESDTDIESKTWSSEDQRFIAVVDDDFVIRELVKAVFEEAGWNVATYENGKTFLESRKISFLDAIFLDLVMPEVNGYQVLSTLKRNENTVPIIVFSSVSHKSSVVKAMQLGVRSYLIKPLKPEKLLIKAEEILNSSF